MTDFSTGGHEAPTEGLKRLFGEARGEARPMPAPRRESKQDAASYQEVAVPAPVYATVPVTVRPRAAASSQTTSARGGCKKGCEAPIWCVVPSDSPGQRMAFVCPVCLGVTPPEPAKAGPQQQWDNYQRALCITYNVCIGSPVEELRRSEAKVGDCGNWISRFIATAGKDVVICNCCNRTAFYGIETLSQTGRHDQALALIRAKITRA